ncbi:MAG: class I SAM-dependent methyltransferase [Chloroflexota bacterium]|nr:class I SAM-dependent methyltransferase [Chloroflexota bacterium]
MLPKPKHLDPKYGMQFQDQSIVDAYHHRPPYPAETFDILSSLITDEPRTVLDVGCGTGDIARNLVQFVDRVDAVDFSEAMLAKGKTLPGGNSLQLRWIYGSVEDVQLFPPYALITAGESVHWMAWDKVFPRFQEMLTPHGYIAIIERNMVTNSWDAELRIIQRYSTNRVFRPYNLIEELEKRSLFQIYGEKRTAPIPFVQSIDQYIEATHSRNGFSRERMTAAQATAFDNEMRNVLAPFAKDEKIALQIVGHIVWGKPHTY